MTDVRGPLPGQELNRNGPPAVPRQAATVVLLRGGPERLEVLLVKRNPQQRFMGGVWVFPGGAVDAAEAADTRPHRMAAIREAEEEAGVILPDPDALVLFSRWITPAAVSIRFDTLFFLAPIPEDAQPQPDGHECVDLRWLTPRGALEARERGEIGLVFPTIKTLEHLSGFACADEALRWAAGADVRPIEPRVIVEGEVARVLLPGEPGYEA